MKNTSNNKKPSVSAVMIRLDEESSHKLTQAHIRSGRSKASEAKLRLEDHLNRYPDFYNSECIEKL